MSYEHEYNLDRRSAEQLAEQAATYATDRPETGSALAAVAQVHATLALAAATMAAAERVEDE
ncbi:hypothetical protein [Nocardiopsis sp. RV163]|uniref:hypothetical protein n=1 Tax=Nocardiopsis sp. RV163 TaxID=1661388 RepID=UPI00064C14DB|nr:hypothetical protein [Nocardiopsis sp. RV163]